jgi:hypothetical protein
MLPRNRRFEPGVDDANAARQTFQALAPSIGRIRALRFTVNDGPIGKTLRTCSCPVAVPA